MGKNDVTTATLNRELKFTGVQSAMVKETWVLVEPLVQKGLALEPGLYEPKDILQLLNEKKMQLWVAIDPEENKILAALVTQLAIYPKGTACWIILVGGSGMSDWVRFMKVIKLWAKSKGCDRILSFSRKGWIRTLAPYGFKKLRTLIGCDLETENENL